MKPDRLSGKLFFVPRYFVGEDIFTKKESSGLLNCCVESGVVYWVRFGTRWPGELDVQGGDY